MCFQDKFECAPENDFYEWANHKWLNNGEEVPAEYPQWGSFSHLRAAAIENQMALLRDMSKQDELDEDERKIVAVWSASQERFAAWEEGEEGLDAPVVERVREVALPLEDEDSAEFASALVQCFARFQREGVPYPFRLEAQLNFDESDSNVLVLMQQELSLETRAHYLGEDFAQQRKFFLAHLDKIATLLGPDEFVDDFAERVLRFETKLATISLTPDQQRLFDKFYTLTSLDNMLADVGSLTSLEAKRGNYEANDEDDDTVLGAATWTPSPEAAELMREVLSGLFDELQLHEAMKSNFAASYPSGKKGAKAEDFMVLDGDFFQRVFDVLLEPGSRKDLLAYLQYCVVRSMSSQGSKQLDEEFFDLYGRHLGGQQLQRGDERRSAELVDDMVGELVGKFYVRRHFSPESKATVLGMIEEVRSVMEESLKTNDWMTKATKREALKKLATFKANIGYPDKWKDFSALKVEMGDSLATVARQVALFRHEADLMAVINTPRDPNKWEMSPQTVNAYFMPNTNDITFPAAILQPPFFHSSLDQVDLDLGDVPLDTEGLLDALNFGGIGAVISHEISHGFDDQGSLFDHEGNLVNWWQPEDRELFNAQCKLMAEQVAKYSLTEELEDGSLVEHHMNAQLTMGENLADVGGLSLACKAMLARLHDKKATRKAKAASLPRQKKGIMGLFRSNTKARKAAAAELAAAEKAWEEEQIELRKRHLEAFFRGWATVWRSKQTLAFAKKKLAVDPHAPKDFRGNVVANIDQFYEVFDVPEESSMFVPKEKRVQMW